jgi:hypothetical protein
MFLNKQVAMNGILLPGRQKRWDMAIGIDGDLIRDVYVLPATD